MFFHLTLKFIHRNTTISVCIHLFEEKFNLFFGDFRMNVFEKRCKLIVFELFLIFETKSLNQFNKVNVIRIDLETQFSHYSFKLIFE